MFLLQMSTDRNGAWMNGWVNTRGAGDSRRIRVHYDVTVMLYTINFLNYTGFDEDFTLDIYSQLKLTRLIK